MSRAEIVCLFRREVRGRSPLASASPGQASDEDRTEVRTEVQAREREDIARCDLLAAIAPGNPEAAEVDLSVCSACEYRDSAVIVDRRPVFASLAYAALEGDVSAAKTTEPGSGDLPASGPSAKSGTPAGRMRDAAEETLIGHVVAPELLATIACDVFICWDQWSRSGSSSHDSCIESLLTQRRALVTVHLFGQVPDDLIERSRTDASLCVHPDDASASGWQVALNRMPSLRTQFVAVIDTNALDSQAALQPDALFSAVTDLLETGQPAASLTAAGSCGPSPSPEQKTAVGQVVRRATLVDLRASDAASFSAIEQAMARRAADPQPVVFREIPSQRVACDVVLPFRGQLEFVTEAIDGLLAQQHVDAVIHLIDDATEASTGESTDAFLMQWRKHPQFRVYRNRENIGQFSSFNNVSRFFETGYAAVQDADDISLPGRLAWSVCSLQLADADIFAAAVELFGARHLLLPDTPDCATFSPTQLPTHRLSYYPRLRGVRYFAENPTLVVRVDAFRELGGFADFGDSLSNRASVDTEFQCRAYLAGARFAISQSVVLKYRSHEGSATQDSESGWRTAARLKATQLVEQRRLLQEYGRFDARSFGALGRYDGLTQRWNPQTARTAAASENAGPTSGGPSSGGRASGCSAHHGATEAVHAG